MCVMVWGAATIYHALTFRPVGQIAFVCRVNNPAKKNDTTLQICRVNADGSERMQLTHNQIVVDPPSWSPDGTQIVFSDFIYDRVSDSRYTALFVMNADGGNLRILTLNGGRNPLWLPDGKHIAFITHEKNRPGDIIGVIELSSLKQALVYVDDLSATDTFSWAPDSKRIALTTLDEHGPQVQLANADGSSQTRLANIWGSSPAWSHDGTQVAFGCTPGNWLVRFAICIANPDGFQITYLAASLFDSPSSPTWSPDGKYIAYGIGAMFINGQIWVMKSDGSQPTQITYGEYDVYPSWQPQR